MDLANNHIAALKAIENKCGVGIYNMGTSHGYSVLDKVNAFVKVYGVEVPYSIMSRTAGDIATCYCDSAKAKLELCWELSMALMRWLEIVGIGRGRIQRATSNSRWNMSYFHE